MTLLFLLFFEQHVKNYQKDGTIPYFLIFNTLLIGGMLLTFIIFKIKFFIEDIKEEKEINKWIKAQNHRIPDKVSTIWFNGEEIEAFTGKLKDLIPENIRQFELSHVDINLSDEDYFELFYSNRNIFFDSKSYNENKEFQIAVDLFNNNQSFFLTGAAGTGKSSFINFITSYTTKKYAIVAPTGIAALNVKGQTIHSFFKFDSDLDIIRYQSNDVPKFENNRRKLIEDLEVIIIDEISMVSVDIMDAMDYSLRINGGNPNLPFGGKQIIIIGDVFQLGPVVNNQIRNELLKFWTNIYFFTSKSYNEKLFQIINLKINYRNADDQEFIKLLDKIKVGEITQNELTLLSNGRIINNINQLENKIILTTTNPNAKQFNDLCLKKLNTDSYFYEAEIIDSFPSYSYPTERTLELKVGAQVMFIKNDSLDGKWVNGTIGKVIELKEDEISVKLNDDTIVRVNRYGFENFEFQYDSYLRKTVKTLIGKFIQFPIKLAWAITIHKSQGLTFEEIIIDVSSGTFGTGQLYVALSRARKLSGVYFTTPLLLNHNKVDNELIEFYNNNILNNH